MRNIGRPIRVCMFPKDIPSNESLGIMTDAMEKTGKVSVRNYSYFFSFFARADIFHVHWVDELVVGVRWPKHIVKVFLFLLYLMFSKLLKRPIIWTVHNVGAYEGNYPKLERLLWRVFLPRVNWAIHLCSASLDAMYRLTAAPPPGSVIPHPHYRSVYEPCDTTGEEVRGSIDPFIFSSFGLIRAYKGFEHLVQIFHSWGLQKVELRIAGAPVFKESAQLGQEMVRLSESDPRIALDLRALNKQELKDFICTSRVVVLPYNKIMNSGVAALALSLGRPILGPAAGCILDYHQKLGADWVLMYDNSLTVQDLKAAYDHLQSRNRSTLPDLNWMEPDRIAGEIIEVYRQQLASC